MKTILYKTILFIVSIALISCSGEDRTYEYLELTQHNNWIYEQMQDVYLWVDSLETPKPKTFFGNPNTFLNNLKSKIRGDKWSYVVVDTIDTDPYARGKYNHKDSYGFDYTLVVDPTGQTSKEYVRVLTVYPNSPAERCGLNRGDFIITFDGYKFSSSNIDRLKKGESHKLKVCHLIADGEDGMFRWSDTLEYNLPASEYVEDIAFPVGRVFTGGEKNIAYLMCTRLVEGADDRVSHRIPDDSYRVMLDAYMADFKKYGVSELVLDLRLCNYGSMDMARRLASSIVTPEYLDRDFVKTIYNKTRASYNESIGFDKSVVNLGLKRVVIITSSMTKGPAEWVIHSLTSLMGEDNVIIIGEKTAGQNVMTQSLVNSDFFLKFYPVVAYVASDSGDYNYFGGIVPKYQVREYEYVELAPYGEPGETLLTEALYMLK